MAGDACEVLERAIRANRAHAAALMAGASILALVGVGIDLWAMLRGNLLAGLGGAALVGVALVPLRMAQRTRRETDKLAVFSAALRAGLDPQRALEVARAFAELGTESTRR